LNSSSEKTYFIYKYTSAVYKGGIQVLQNVRPSPWSKSTICGEVVLDTARPQKMLLDRLDGWNKSTGTLLTEEEYQQWKGEHIELFL
jgi:hypothetical protein